MNSCRMVENDFSQQIVSSEPISFIKRVEDEFIKCCFFVDYIKIFHVIYLTLFCKNVLPSITS